MPTAGVAHCGMRELNSPWESSVSLSDGRVPRMLYPDEERKS
jgi:hypothetical protein